jgi:hypothetical protein
VRPGPTHPDADLPARLDRLLGARTDRLERIPVRSGQRIRFLAFDSIDWIEGDDNYVRLHAGPAEHRVRGALKSFAEALPPSGTMSHPSLHLLASLHLLEEAFEPGWVAGPGAVYGETMRIG